MYKYLLVVYLITNHQCMVMNHLKYVTGAEFFSCFGNF
jgi:hypothetical protein